MCGGRKSKRVSNSAQLDLNHDHTGGPIYYINCENTFESDNIPNYCIHCGEKLKKCSISKNIFQVGQSFGQCPHCFSVFHKQHLDSWISNSEKCPICRTTLDYINTGIIGKNFIPFK